MVLNMSLLRGLLFLIHLFCPVCPTSTKSWSQSSSVSLLNAESWSICDKVISLARWHNKISSLWEAMYTPHHLTKDYLGCGVTPKTTGTVLGLV